MRYLCAGIYAEGPTDYAYLLPLLDQLLPSLTHAELSIVPTVGDSVGIDAPEQRRARRAERIAAAVDAFWGQCTLFVIHADGGGDPERALREQVEPGIALSRAMHPDLAVAACVPVREIEAWLLADDRPFRRLLGPDAPSDLPSDPEAVHDPKRELSRLLAASGGPRLQREAYGFFGANADRVALRRLPAFCRFEEQLVRAIRLAERVT